MHARLEALSDFHGVFVYLISLISIFPLSPFGSSLIVRQRIFFLLTTTIYNKDSPILSLSLSCSFACDNKLESENDDAKMYTNYCL